MKKSKQLPLVIKGGFTIIQDPGTQFLEEQYRLGRIDLETYIEMLGDRIFK